MVFLGSFGSSDVDPLCDQKRMRSMYELKSNKVLKGGVFVILGIGVIYAVGALLSSPIVNANKYQKLVQPEERNFTDDIKEISYDQIPLLDKESASLFRNRKMGSMVDLVSQFEVMICILRLITKGKPYTSDSSGICQCHQMAYKPEGRNSSVYFD